MHVKGGGHHYNLHTIDISSCFKYCLVFINKHLILYRHQGCMVFGSQLGAMTALHVDF